MTTAAKDFVFISDEMLEGMDISPSDVADAVETALVAKAKGRLHTSPKTAILPGRARYMMSTLAVGDDGFVVVKQVSLCPENPKRDLPAINGAIMVLDAETGLLRAVLGANWITAVRTAALSAVAARRLADPQAETLAFVGAGVQAHSHLEAFSGMFPLKRIRVFGRGQANIDRLCQKAIDLGYEARACPSAEDALRGADLVMSAVNLDYSIKPFLDARWLQPNAFVTITDACVPWHPETLNAFGTLIVDDLQQEEQNDKPMVPFEQVTGDLTGLVTDSIAKPAEGAPTAFAFRGIALGDYAAAVLAVQRADTSGVGLRISQ